LKIAKQHCSSVGSVYRFYRGVGAESPGHGPGLSFFFGACVVFPTHLPLSGRVTPNPINFCFPIDQFAQPEGPQIAI
jgi:hypothetical protein